MITLRWDLNGYIQTDKQAMANRTDIVVADKVDKKAVVKDVEALKNSNTRRLVKPEKHQGLIEQWVRMWGVETTSSQWSLEHSGCYPQDGGVAPTDPRNNIWDLFLSIYVTFLFDHIHFIELCTEMDQNLMGEYSILST